MNINKDLSIFRTRVIKFINVIVIDDDDFIYITSLKNNVAFVKLDMLKMLFGMEWWEQGNCTLNNLIHKHSMSIHLHNIRGGLEISVGNTILSLYLLRTQFHSLFTFV